jgi:hypothetical protein
MNDSRVMVLGLVLCIGLGISCSNIRVTTDFDPSVDFGAFRTYAWLPDPSGCISERERAEFPEKHAARIARDQSLMRR